MRRSFFLIAVGAVALMGCSNKVPRLKTYPVSGTVTYNGKPLEGATVAYVGSNVDAHRSTGTTDSEGRFSLTTYAGPQQLLRGAVPGEYQVTISKVKAIATQASNTDQMANWQNLSEQERQELMQKNMQRMVPRGTNNNMQKPPDNTPVPEIPERYSQPETSGLTAQVVEGENAPREFKLTDN
jgi:hypothetical protein